MGFLTTVFEVLDFDPSVQKARKLEWDGDLDGAIRSLNETIQTKGPSAMRLDKMGWLYVLKGQPKDALSYCEQAVALSKGKTKYQATRAGHCAAQTVRRGAAALAGAVPEEQDGHFQCVGAVSLVDGHGPQRGGAADLPGDAETVWRRGGFVACQQDRHDRGIRGCQGPAPRGGRDLIRLSWQKPAHIVEDRRGGEKHTRPSRTSTRPPPLLHESVAGGDRAR